MDVAEPMPAPRERRQRTKRVILIRNGQSTWNEFLGRVRSEAKEVRSASSSSTSKPVESKQQGRFWQGLGQGVRDGVRGGVKHAAIALMNAGKLHQVDHPLSLSGLAEARALRSAIVASLLREQTSIGNPAGISEAEVAAETALLRCRHWFISPFLRALQTAAYALSPLHKNDASLMSLRVTPQCNDIVRSRLSHDCHGKKDNVGFRMTARAINKTSESLQEEEEHQRLVQARQQELQEVITTLCAMDLSDVSEVWWSDVHQFKKENRAEQMDADDARIRRLVFTLLNHEADEVGVIASSLLFQRILQLFCPLDPAAQDQLRASLRKGSSMQFKDPFKDKVVSGSTLVLTFKYGDLDRYATEAKRWDAEIVGAHFLFGGHMESEASMDRQTIELPDDAEDGFDDADRVLAVGKGQREEDGLDDVGHVLAGGLARREEEIVQVQARETSNPPSEYSGESWAAAVPEAQSEMPGEDSGQRKDVAPQEVLERPTEEPQEQEAQALPSELQEGEKRQRKELLLKELLRDHESGEELWKEAQDQTRRKRLSELFSP